MPKGIYIRTIPIWNKGLKGEEYLKHYPNGHKGREKGYKHTEETKEKMRNNHTKYWKGKEQPKEALRKRTVTRRKNGWNKNPKEMSIKLREAKWKYILKNGGGPTIGKNEKRILDELELSLGYKIIRQYRILGYCVDGYCKKLNLIIEIDEDYHSKKIQQDNIRQKEIENKLKCIFLRIKDKKS